MKLDESSWKGSEPSQSSSRTHLRILCWLIAINGAIRTRLNSCSLELERERKSETIPWILSCR